MLTLQNHVFHNLLMILFLEHRLNVQEYQNYKYYYNRGNLYAKIKDYDNGIKNYNLALQLNKFDKRI